MQTEMLIGSKFEKGTETEEQILNPKTGEVKGAKSWKALEFKSYRERVVAAMAEHESECDGTCSGGAR